MPVQTQLQQRRGTAASWTSTNPTLAAGEIGFESDTGKFKIGNGSTAWASLAYATNGAVVSPLTTKGDLFTYSTTNARLAVGANGESLVADSSTSTGLRYQASTAAGRNFLINGGMDIAQRGTTFTSVNSVYTLDRWYYASFGTSTTANVSQGSTDSVTGFQYYAKVAANSATNSNYNLGQTIETANTVPLRGKTVTLSFYLRAPIAFSNVFTWELRYSTSTDTRISNAGTGTGIGSGVTFTPTTSWTRYSQTFTIPTDASSLAFIIGTYNNTVSTANFDITGVQLEIGSVATTFTRAGGTIQGELAACQRYYYKVVGGSNLTISMCSAEATNTPLTLINFPVTMRSTTTLEQVTGTNYYGVRSAGTGTAQFNSFTLDYGSTYGAVIYATGTITAGYAGRFLTQNGASSIAFNAEL